MLWPPSKTACIWTIHLKICLPVTPWSQVNVKESLAVHSKWGFLSQATSFHSLWRRGCAAMHYIMRQIPENSPKSDIIMCWGIWFMSQFLFKDPQTAANTYEQLQSQHPWSKRLKYDRWDNEWNENKHYNDTQKLFLTLEPQTNRQRGVA